MIGQEPALALEQMLPSHVAIASWDQVIDVSLYPEEKDAIVNAVPARRLEFARGRACARAALGNLGVPPGPIPVGANREPIWPTDFVGSITHQAGVVLAVAARRDDFSAIGVDVERSEPLADDTSALIGSKAEWRVVRAHGLPDTLLFSAKEAVFKALFPLIREWIDFLDVQLSFDLPSGRFSAEPVSDVLPTALTENLEGRFSVVGDHAVTVAFIQAESFSRLGPEGA